VKNEDESDVAQIRPDSEDSRWLELVLGTGDLAVARERMPGAGAKLSKVAFAHGARVVHHDYNLAADEVSRAPRTKP
jgi:hypothetical protein